MKRVTWATVATRTPMGQQTYESEIQHALIVLAAPDWQFRSVPVTSWRSSISGARRMPAGFNARAPLPAALVIGASLYRTSHLVHRFDLRLPPHLGREVVTAHDLPPARFTDEGGLPRSIAAGARRARAIIAPSAFAAGELQELLGVTNVKVVPYGVSDAFRSPRPATDALLRQLGIRQPYLLHAAGATIRKNLPALASAWRDLSTSEPELSLVLCGPANTARDEAFADLSRVRMTGRLDPHVVASLMRSAAVVVVPSLYEGFGLPALEGMACGRPVVAARAGALPEVCGDAALLVEPDAQGLADGISSALHDVGLRQQLEAAGPKRALLYSWEDAARAHLDIYAAAVE